MKPSEYLGLVRSEISDRGWTKKVYQDEIGMVCLEGAMNRVTRGHCKLRRMGRAGSTAAYERYHQVSDAIVEARMLLQDMAREMGAADIVDLNDSFFASRQDVFDFLDKASFRLEEAGK